MKRQATTKETCDGGKESRIAANNGRGNRRRQREAGVAEGEESSIVAKGQTRFKVVGRGRANAPYQHLTTSPHAKSIAGRMWGGKRQGVEGFCEGGKRSTGTRCRGRERGGRGTHDGDPGTQPQVAVKRGIQPVVYLRAAVITQ